MCPILNLFRYKAESPAWVGLLSACLWVVLSVASFPASDKSGVSPTAISLPSGPGSIEGLGPEFEPSLNTGTAGYSVSLRLPGGIAGNSPALSLIYEGGNGNSPLGIGWSLSMPLIRRQCDKGIPHYHPNGKDDDFDGYQDEADEQDRFLDPTGQELVLMDNGIYYPETQEQFIRWRYIQNGENDYWEGLQPNGSLLHYGLSEEARIFEGNRIFGWLLEKQTDPHGNVILFKYAAYPGSEGQKYLEEIQYGPGAPPWRAFYFVRLIYEDRPDVLDDYRSGFLIRTGKRLAQLDIALQGDEPEGHLLGDINLDGATDALVRRYRLAYEADPHWSLLTKVTLIGSDGIRSLPPAVFGYPKQEPPRLVSAEASIILSRNEPDQVMDNDFVDLVDLNADGLPDILRTGLAGRHTAYLNEGPRKEESERTIQWGAMQYVLAEDSQDEALARDLADSAVCLSDMDGDGLADLVFHPSLSGQPLYYRNKGSVAWGKRQSMAVGDDLPPAPFAHANVRSFDVNFDKRMDIVKSIGTGYQVWYNLGPGEEAGVRYSPRVLTPGAIHEEGVLVFGDEFGIPASGIQLADFNGDRIIDVARIRPTQVIFCASKGYGEYAPSAIVSIPTDDGFGIDSGFSYLTTEQIDRAVLSDITGDGLADLVVERAGFRQLWYWINLGNGTLDTRRLVTELPGNFTTLEPSVRWADMNGNGTTDLVYSDSGLSDGFRIRIVDVGLLIQGSAYVNLLTTIENGIGLKTEIEYLPSTSFALDDAAAGSPWAYAVPNPTSVINRITVQDGLGNEYVSEFRYHDGYYHGVEKEFRGFARAERIDIGDESQPTLVTEYQFNVGSTEEALKGKALRMIARTESGEIFSEETNNWEARSLFDVSPVPLDPLLPDNVVFPYMRSKIQIVREEPSGATQAVLLRSSYAYDDYGNQVMAANYGRVHGENYNFGNDERIAWTAYCATPESPIWNVPIEFITTDNSYPPQVAAHSRSYYDGDDFAGGPLGIVTHGNLMRTRIWAGPYNPPNPPEPMPHPEARFLSVIENLDHSLSFSIVDSASSPVKEEEDHWIDTLRSRYDSYGNLTTSADPLASIAGGIPDFDNGHLREFLYDPILHTFPVRERIHTGDGNSLDFSAVYDLAFGAIISSTDFNGNRTDYRHDALLRLASVVSPGGATPDSESMPSIRYDYVLAAPVPIAGGTGTVNWVETRTHEEFGDPEAYLVSRTYRDGLGQIVMVKSESDRPDRSVVQQAITLNKRRQPSCALLPFYGSEDLDFEDVTAAGWKGGWIIEGQEANLSLQEAPSLHSYYDAAGRPIRRVNADGTFSRIAYFPLSRIEWDEEDANPSSPHYDTPLCYYEDGLGRMTGVDEITYADDQGGVAASPGRWHTRYAYDLLDNLIEIVDSQGNMRLFHYDPLKRLTYADDPNRGRRWNRYDDASNIVESVDAKGQRTNYTYDGVNRLLTEDYHDEAEPFSAGFIFDPASPIGPRNRPDVVFYYDSASEGCTSRSAQNTRGKLASVLDLAGEEHLSYDARGNLSWKAKCLQDPGNGVKVSYETSIGYDAMSRIAEIVYPDGDSVEYVYDSQGLLRRILGGAESNRNGRPDIAENILYTPFRQIRSCAYGNGIVTVRNYDRRTRIESIATAPDGDPENPILAYRYTLDGSSNVLRIDDWRPSGVHPQGDRRRNTQIFSYDDLSRLIGVQYSYALPGSSDGNQGRIEYRYDRIGNMLFKSSPDGQGHIDHNEHGRSIVNLGQMAYGGDWGDWNRIGRPPGSPPGPQALTSLTDGRVLAYDDNGNLTEVDGLLCTYDFRDHLVQAENEDNLIKYTYDYTGHRIRKEVWTLSGNGLSNATEHETTLYIGNHFEIRGHDQPVKYVWNAETRIARITGTLNESAQRIQRIRVFPGWNLLSLGVDSASAAAQIAERINPSTFELYVPGETIGKYTALGPSDPLPAGQPFWLRAAVETVLEIQGDYAAPAEILLASGSDLFAWSGLEALSTQDSFPDTIDRLWYFDAQSGCWRGRLPEPVSFVSANGMDFLSPGQAIAVHSLSESQIALPPASWQILYYHQDYLGSTSLLCDGQGNIVEESHNYPFGYPRIEARADDTPEYVTGNYGFCQKERDPETGLHYFENRYLASSLGRFSSVDPLAMEIPSKALLDPQKLNSYSYARNNPMLFVDHDGELSQLSENAIGCAAVKGLILEGFYSYRSLKNTNLSAADAQGYAMTRMVVGSVMAMAESVIEKSIESKFVDLLGSDKEDKIAASVLGEMFSAGIFNIVGQAAEWKIDKAFGVKDKDAGYRVPGAARRGGEFVVSLGLGAASGAVCGAIQESLGDNAGAEILSGILDTAISEGGKALFDFAIKKYETHKQKEIERGRAASKEMPKRQKSIVKGGSGNPRD